MILRRLLWAAIALGAALWWLAERPRGIPTDAPIDWSREPVQSPTAAAPFRLATRRREVTLTPRAAYDVAAVVARVERYRFDDGAFLAPYDLVLTWGDLPRPDWRRRIDYRQLVRFYSFRAPPELDPDYIARHSANTHLIPATPNLRRALAVVGRGDAVRLSGLLVDVERPDGSGWRTSLRRDDGGAGACELLYLTALQNGERLYR